MIKTIIGALAGFLVWSALWIGCDFVIRAVAPSIVPNDDFSVVPTSFLVTKLILSVFFSIASGYLAAVVASESRHAPLILGVALLAFGTAVTVSMWDARFIVFNGAFLALLLPMAVIGGRLRK